jgi:hypothetical protein
VHIAAEERSRSWICEGPPHVSREAGARPPERSVSDEPKSEIAFGAAPFTQAMHSRQNLTLLVVDSNGKQLIQLAQKLGHLVQESSSVP